MLLEPNCLKGRAHGFALPLMKFVLFFTDPILKKKQTRGPYNP